MKFNSSNDNKRSKHNINHTLFINEFITQVENKEDMSDPTKSVIGRGRARLRSNAPSTIWIIQSYSTRTAWTATRAKTTGKRDE